ncbi:MAG: DNA polymerase III subunit epsilon [Geminicoccaceae bacterium]|nr:DNA polymerase III subunit epsilon [Geminicoccaceae bacterium]
MREIVLDTETTGFDPKSGDRVVEIGAVEVVHKLATGGYFHRYLNPERDMPEDAFKVHGLSSDFLADKPVFKDVADDFLAFIGDSPLVIHNAAFDMRFLNHELKAVGYAPIAAERAVDTLLIAQKKFPGSPNSLDALCRRFEVDGSARVRHGALLDCELLAEVYLHLCGGRQVGLDLAVRARRRASPDERPFREARDFPVAEAELRAHAAFVATLKNPIWNT